MDQPPAKAGPPAASYPGPCPGIFRMEDGDSTVSLDHLHSTPSASDGLRDQSVPTAPCPATGHHGIEPGRILCAPPLRVLLHCGKAPSSLVLPQLWHPPRPLTGRAEQNRPGPPSRAPLPAGAPCPPCPNNPAPTAVPSARRDAGPGRAGPRRLRHPPGASLAPAAAPARGSKESAIAAGKGSTEGAPPAPYPADPHPRRCVLPGARSPPHHVPAAANRGAPRPRLGPARPCRGTGPARGLGAPGEPLLPVLLPRGAAFPWQILVLTK